MIAKHTFFCSSCNKQLPQTQFINTGQGLMHKCSETKLASGYEDRGAYEKIIRINKGDDKHDTLKQGDLRDNLHESISPSTELENLKDWFTDMNNRVGYGRTSIKNIYQSDLDLGIKLFKKLNEKITKNI